MTRLPTIEEIEEKILVIFSDFNIRPTESLPARSILHSWFETGYKNTELADGLESLIKKGYLEDTGNGSFRLTEKVNERSSKKDATRLESAAVNIINIHHMEGSQIHQGGIGGSQAGSFASKEGDDSTAAATDRNDIARSTNIQIVDRGLTLLFGIGAILVGAFGNDQLHFLMVLFIFLTISIGLFDLFRHTTLKKRWHIFTILTITLFLLCGAWEIQHSKPSFIFGRHKTQTLLDYFNNDFRSLPKASEDRIITLRNKESITIKSTAWLDFESQTVFIGFYIPDTPHAYSICTYLASNYKTALDLRRSVLIEQSGGGMQPVNSNELQFSGRVFLYHETPLLEEQRHQLVNLYKSKGLAPQFRDYQYVADLNKAR